MLNDSDIFGLNRFLAKGAKNAMPCVQAHDGVFSAGVSLGDWRIAALIGHGGSAEVYRVVNVATQAEAAAKVLVSEEAAAQRRFQGEIDFLSQNRFSQFPRYFASGEFDEHKYLILELLEPIDLPVGEKDIVAYFMEVCACVRALHLAGIVHRDLKPTNIMRRPGGSRSRSSVVLIDFGLAKDALASPQPRAEVSIVSGKALGVGTPGYAAPEQLTGGEISPAADIHALGRIANAAFDGKPPCSWVPIIRRATSSIPEQRYETVDDFVTAIRNRNRPRNVIWTCLVAAVVAVFALVFSESDEHPIVVSNAPPRVRNASSSKRFNALCENMTTNVVSHQLLWEKLVTNEFGTVYPEERAYRDVTNVTDITLVRLNRATNVFARPIQLKPNHEYWVVGPGVLDAAVSSAGSNTTIRLENCVFRNRSPIPLDQAGVRYVSQGGVYLNFTDLDRLSNFAFRHFDDFDGAFNKIEFRDDSELFKDLELFKGL